MLHTDDLPNAGDDGLWRWPEVTAQVWPRWLRDDRDRLTAAFDEASDNPPKADVMLAVADDGRVLGGVMKDTFRSRAVRDSNGLWTLAPVLPPRAIESMYQTCSRDGCGARAPFQTNMTWLCYDHWCELCDGPWEH
jgi:hypothetical protein